MKNFLKIRTILMVRADREKMSDILFIYPRRGG